MSTQIVKLKLTFIFTAVRRWLKSLNKMTFEASFAAICDIKYKSEVHTADYYIVAYLRPNIVYLTRTDPHATMNVSTGHITSVSNLNV